MGVFSAEKSRGVPALTLLYYDGPNNVVSNVSFLEYKQPNPSSLLTKN